MTLTNAQRRYQRIVELSTDGGKTQPEIASELGVSLATVERYISKWRKGVPVDEVRDVGRPSQLTDSVRRSIVTQLNRDEFSTSGDIAHAIVNDGAGEVANRTVRSYLSRLSYQNSLPRVVPFITDAQKERRVQWAQAYREFDWSSVFFSDETTIQLSANITRAWHKKGNRPNVARTKFPLKVMFWGAISAHRKSPLFAVSGN